MSEDNTRSELASIIRDSPAGPIIREYLDMRLTTVRKQKDNTSDFESFTRLRARQAELESLRNIISRPKE